MAHQGWSRGRTFQRGARWWIAYHVDGKEHREPAGDTDREARRKLKDRLGEVYGGRFVGPEGDRLRVPELLDALESHLRLKGAKSLVSLRSHLRPVRAFFTLTRAIDVTAAAVERYAAERIGKRKAPATVNREVGALKQALNLAMKQGRLARVPYVPLLREENVRQGFFERSDFECVASHLPGPIDDVARFAYWSGWRRGEILGLRWDQVDRASREVRLRTSKNGRGRAIPLEGELREIIERRWAAREVRLAPDVARIADCVFHRAGRGIVDFKKAWAAACTAAHVPGLRFHDLRRTAARNMVRAGVPETVAMSITGHRTRAMFDRYNITSQEDQRDALRQLDQYVAALPAHDEKIAALTPKRKTAS